MRLASKSVFILVLVVGNSCNTFSQNQEFQDWMDRFEEKQLPFSINRNDLSLLEKIDDEPADSLLVSNFIEKNRVIGNNSMFDFFRYYPLYKIDLGGYVGLVSLKRGGAGAIDDRVMLRVFDYDGHSKSELLIANNLGDCSRRNILTCSIELDYNIYLSRNIESLECDTESVLSVDKSTQKYAIDSSGSINKMK